MFRDTPVLSSFPASARLACLRSGRSYSRRELAAAVDLRAADIAQTGLARGDRVVIAEKDAAEYLISLFACWSAGFCAVAVNPELKPDEQSRVIESTRASAWLGSLQVALPEAPPLKPQQIKPLQQDDPALIMMTSGTTGVPKGVTHTLRSLATRLSLNRSAIDDSAMRRSLCVLPVFFGHGLIGNCLTPLNSGAELYLWTAPTVAELVGFGAMLDDQRITFFSSVPTFWKSVLRVSERPGAGPGRVHVGSAPLSRTAWKAIVDWTGTRQVFNMFGMTETANWISGTSFDEATTRDGDVGHPWGGRFAVLADGVVGAEGTGEVLIVSPSIMQGYWAQEAKTSAAFEGEWLRSGDIGTLAADGFLTLKGRIKSEINRGGLKVLAEEIDMLLERHSDVAEASAFAIADPVSGEAVGAAVVLRDGAQFDQIKLKNWCREQVRAEAVPQRLYVLTELPRNDRGKVVRSQVRDAAIARGIE